MFRTIQTPQGKLAKKAELAPLEKITPQERGKRSVLQQIRMGSPEAGDITPADPAFQGYIDHEKKKAKDKPHKEFFDKITEDQVIELLMRQPSK